MSGVLQFMGGIRQCGKHHRAAIRIHFKEHTSSLPVCYFCIPDPGLCSAFLRHDIGSHVVFHQIPVNAQSGTLAPVSIGLSRTQTVPFQMVIICAELKHYAEFRHIAQLFHRIIGKGRLYSSISIHFIGQPALGIGRSRKNIGKGHLCFIILCFQLRLQNPGVGILTVVFVGSIQTGDLPLAISCSHKVSIVIIRRRSPEIGFGNGLDHFLSAVFVGSQASVQSGEEHFKALAPQADVVSASDHFNLFPAFLPFSLYLINILSESNLMSLRRPGGILFQKKRYRNHIFSGLCLLCHRQGISFL